MATTQQESEDYEKAKIKFRDDIKRILYSSCGDMRFTGHCDVYAEQRAKKYAMNDSVPSDTDLRRDFGMFLREQLGQKAPTPALLEAAADDVERYRQVISEEPEAVKIDRTKW